MVAGDLNVYPRPDDPFLPPDPSDQLAPLYDAGLHDLYDTVIAADPAAAYSYVFDGQAQDLDHQFVTESLFDGLRRRTRRTSTPTGRARPGRTVAPPTTIHGLALDAEERQPADRRCGRAVRGRRGELGHADPPANDPDGDPVTYAWDLDGNGTLETSGQSTVVSAADSPEARP